VAFLLVDKPVDAIDGGGAGQGQAGMPVLPGASNILKSLPTRGGHRTYNHRHLKIEGRIPPMELLRNCGYDLRYGAVAPPHIIQAECYPWAR